jgi:LuxR family quorum sensing-dependent transcriptional regulator
MTPYLWHDIPRRLADTAGSRLVANEATEYGLHSGYIVPTYSRLHWHSLVSFASSARTVDLSKQELTGLQLMAAVAMRAVENLRKPDLEVRYLSPREREVLLWAARDKTAEETAAILSISVTTVRKHLQNARRTFGVSSTLAAVAAALHWRQIVL